MIKTYYDHIKETIQQHPEIPPAVVADVLERCREYLSEEYMTENSSFICKEYNYLLEWIK